jgi:hypothetical protein
VASYKPQPLYLREKSPRYPMDKRLGGSRSRPELCRVDKTFFPLPGIEPWPSSLYPVAIVLFLFNFLGWGETKSTWHVDQHLAIVPAPHDDDYGAVGGMRIGRGNRSTRRKPTPVPLCPPQIPHDLGSNPGRRGGKSATNCLSYGTAISRRYND